MAKSQRLELTWMGKEIRPRLEPRILIEDESLSYCASSLWGKYYSHKGTKAQREFLENQCFSKSHRLSFKARQSEN